MLTVLWRPMCDRRAVAGYAGSTQLRLFIYPTPFRPFRSERMAADRSESREAVHRQTFASSHTHPTSQHRFQYQEGRCRFLDTGSAGFAKEGRTLATPLLPLAI